MDHVATEQTLYLHPSVGGPRTLPDPLSLSYALSPRGSEIAAVLIPKNGNPPARQPTSAKRERMMWMAKVEKVAPELREFYISTSVVFIGLQQLHDAEPKGQAGIGALLEASLAHYARIIRVYYDTLTTIPEPSQHTLYLSGILFLAQVLFLPGSGNHAGLVGEEMLDWLNTIDVRPTTEEGEEYESSRKPWTMDGFWEYLQRAILRGFPHTARSFLKTVVESHTSSPLRLLIRDHIIPLVESHPRSKSYDLQSQYEKALFDWKTRVLEAEAAFHESHKGMRQKEDWVEGVRGILEIYQGKEDRIYELARTGGGWREVIGVWGIWVRSTMRRDEIPPLVEKVIQIMPPDMTQRGQNLQLALVRGDISQSLSLAANVSLWLVAHLVDLFDKLELTAAYMNEETAELRAYYILIYAEHLLSEPALWRQALSYAHYCGEAGRIWTADAICHISLDLPIVKPPELPKGPNGAAPKTNGVHDDGYSMRGGSLDLIVGRKSEVRLGEDYKKVEELLAICTDDGLEDEMRSICKVVSEHMARQREYGVAISYAVRASDARRVRRIAERLLREYLQHGSSMFIELVDDLPPSLLCKPGDDNYNPEYAVFAAQLAFVARYREFQKFYQDERRREAANALVELFLSVAPKTWWAVLLVDAFPLLQDEDVLITQDEAFELLRCLEEICTRSRQGCADDYLEALISLLTGGAELSTTEKKQREADALEQLEIVRLELARQIARCSVAGRVL